MTPIEDIIENLQQQIDELNNQVIDLQVAEENHHSFIYMTDGVTAPSTDSGWGILYIDTADGDLKIKFGDGTVKTIVADT